MSNSSQNRQHFSLLVTSIFVAGIAAILLLGSGWGQAEAKVKIKTQPGATVIGSDTCAECHEDAQLQLNTSPHGQAMMAAETQGRGAMCEGCHGPGSVHADDPSEESAAPLLAVARSGDGCFQCHGKNKNLSFTDWQRSPHHREGIACLQCHGETRTVISAPHDVTVANNEAAPEEDATFNHAAFTREPSSDACLSCHRPQQAEFALPSHHPVQEGRVGCTDCHDPHKRMTTRDGRDACQKCHAEQSGPHIYQHGANTRGMTDGCLECHRPHGSANADLLKLSGRGVCLQCHADKARHFTGRNCQQCHTAVHGSNSNRLLFQR